MMKRFFCLCTVFALIGAAAHADLNDTIESAARDISGKLSKGARIAIVAFSSDSDKVSDYIMEELTYAFTEKALEVADRSNLPYVRKELQLQAGATSDKDAQKIGEFVGAETVITGDFVPLGSTYRFRVTAIQVKTAVRLTGVRYDVQNDSALQTMLGALNRNQLASRAADARPHTATPAKSAGMWLDEGIKLASQRRFDEAVNAFTQALRIDSNFDAAYLQRGNALLASISDVSGMTEDFKFAIKIPERHLTGDEQEIANRAIADMSESIKRNPTVKAYNRRSLAYMFMGDYDRAISDCNQALMLDPHHAGTYARRGVVYALKGDYDRAIADCNQAIRLDPNDAGAYHDRGYTFLHKDDTGRAIADFSQAIKLDPNSVSAYSGRGSAYALEGDLPRAVADLNHVIKLDPNSADAYYTRGLAYAVNGDLNKAIIDWETVLRIDPNHKAKQDIETARKMLRRR
jgi:tetratricopeptide (TPR) repeat protein